MQQILGFMVAQIRHQYLIGFVPEASASAPRTHKLEVRLINKKQGMLLGGTRTVVHWQDDEKAKLTAQHPLSMP